MSGPIALFEVNPKLDRESLARTFARERRIQIGDVLTAGTAEIVHRILEHETPWGLAWHAAEEGPFNVRNQALAAMPPAARGEFGRKTGQAAARGDYAFMYGQYPMLDAYLNQWDQGGPHDLLLEHINDAPFLDLVREVTGMDMLVKADAQATLFAPGQFLSMHDDSHEHEGWQVAYVLSLAKDWRPDWGGYLMFYDEEGDVIAGLRPRFNALNLFAVPQSHNVTYVPPFAPVARYAITGWLRDR